MARTGLRTFFIRMIISEWGRTYLSPVSTVVRPASDLSSTSDTAGVVTMSSSELQVEQMLAFLEGESVVTSVLLTSTGALGS